MSYDPYLPTVYPYPGQGQPSPAIGQPTHIPTPPGPVTAPETHIPNPTVPETVVAIKIVSAPTVSETGQRVRSSNPQPVATARGNYTPIPTPIGVSPQYKTPTENWYWDYGQGGLGRENFNSGV